MNNTLTWFVSQLRLIFYFFTRCQRFVLLVILSESYEQDESLSRDPISTRSSLLVPTVISNQSKHLLYLHVMTVSYNQMLF